MEKIRYPPEFKHGGNDRNKSVSRRLNARNKVESRGVW